MNARPRVWASAAALCAAAILPLRGAHAQEASATGAAVTTDSLAAAAPVAVGPTLASASVAVRATAESPAVDVASRPLSSAAANAPTNALPARNSQGQPKALMIVGGAAFIAGALIGDTAGTAIMIGGAGVGLYGLYLYLQ
ncbi:MAG TPA: hypothetical protein VFJ74_02890 [Gemmatimonadaceae bacterium]|nr:hypothetical protein [Gemmatimonadaceae bacterium]